MGAALAASAGVLLIAATGAQLLLVPQNVQAFTADPVAGQQQAASWIRSHLPANSRVIVDMSISMDLHALASSADPVYPQAQW